MRLGFLSAILPECSFSEVIDIAAENGLSCVELACWPKGNATRRYSGVTHIDMETLDQSQVQQITGYARDKNVEISSIGYYPNPLHEDKEVREAAARHLRACILGAEKLGVGLVNTFIGRNRMETPERNLELFSEVWPPLIAFAEQHNVKIGIENCPMYFWTEWPNGDNLASTPAFWKTMFSLIPSSHFGLNYDPSHLVWRQMDYIKPIHEFADKLFHFHVKDAVFHREKYDEMGPFAPPLSYHEPKLPGLGGISWRSVIDALYAIGYAGPLIIEIEDRAYEDTIDDRKEAIRLSANYIRQFLK